MGAVFLSLNTILGKEIHMWPSWHFDICVVMTMQLALISLKKKVTENISHGVCELSVIILTNVPSCFHYHSDTIFTLFCVE
jgi:hypothetical protein